MVGKALALPVADPGFGSWHPTCSQACQERFPEHRPRSPEHGGCGPNSSPQINKTEKLKLGSDQLRQYI